AAQLTVLRARLGQVLAAVKARIEFWKGIQDEGRVRVVARQQKKLPHLVGDQDVLIRARGCDGVVGLRDRHDYRIRRRLSVVIRSRWEVDEADSDERWLVDDPSGASIWEEDVIDALVGDWIPEDADGNALLWEPIFLLRGDDYESSRDLHSRAEDQNWGEV